MFNWMLGQLRKGCEKIVYSWKSSERKSAEQREEKREKSRSQSNSVFAQFSVVCMFNWMLGQLRKGCGKVVCSWKSYELKSAEQREEKREKSRSQPNSVFAQFSVVCMFNWMLGQLRKGCGKVVCSWKSSEFESAEQCEGKCHKSSPSAQFSVCSIGCSAD